AVMDIYRLELSVWIGFCFVLKGHVFAILIKLVVRQNCFPSLLAWWQRPSTHFSTQETQFVWIIVTV
ncbi:MAG: hypothetical protein JAY75_20030, partial [Candidatus Thiodiazotropha taylori]|nr:hypothetical protein [Candidatus Thiodiazotropha taylori]MCW4310508.1 hypothetical protein [Candidatus Thiodiazotropha endolucinida]